MAFGIRVLGLQVSRHAFFCVSWFVVFTMASIAQSNLTGEDKFLYGELDEGKRLFRFIIHATTNGEEITATLTSMDEGNRTFKLPGFQWDEQRLFFELKETGAFFEGKLSSSDDSSIQGTWKQRGVSLPLAFKTVPSVPIDSPDEIWRGTMNAGIQALVIQVRGYVGGDGKKFYFLDSVSQNVGGFKTTMRMVDDKTVGGTFVMETPALRATYTGTLNDDNTEIIGIWKQTKSIKLNLTKVNTVADSTVVKANRPQTPLPPFPYEIREVTFQTEEAKSSLNRVTFGFMGGSKIDLFGTLTVPKGAISVRGGKFPLAILISGSGPQDRDETILEHKPFWVIADQLSRRGIAVLRYDERGVGKSKGNFATATTADFANDVKSAFAFAKTLDEIDHSKIGLIGHSEGGLVAPMVAAEEPSVDWIILMAGPGVNGEQILYSQGALIIEAEGGSEKDKKKQRRIQELAFHAIQSPGGNGRIEPLVSPIVDQLLIDLQSGDTADVESRKTQRRGIEKQVRASLLVLKSPWFQFFAKHEPGPVLEKVRCPVMAINGSKDVQVDPKLNLPKIEEHLKRGGNQSVFVKEFEGLNHMFQTCKTGGLTEYATLEETIAPIVLQEMGDWILSSTR
jgi:pimeloyl-ACP methyl ester carboxylesterase